MICNQIDLLLSTELLDPKYGKSLFDAIKTTMVHGPCVPLNLTAPCTENRECVKMDPRPDNTDSNWWRWISPLQEDKDRRWRIYCQDKGNICSECWHWQPMDRASLFHVLKGLWFTHKLLRFITHSSIICVQIYQQGLWCCYAWSSKQKYKRRRDPVPDGNVF